MLRRDSTKYNLCYKLNVRRRMASPPNEKGIMNAMKSMKTIAGKASFKGGLTPNTMAFPSPPRVLAKKTAPSFSANKKKKTSPPNVRGTTRPKKKSSRPPPFFFFSFPQFCRVSLLTPSGDPRPVATYFQYAMVLARAWRAIFWAMNGCALALVHSQMCICQGYKCFVRQTIQNTRSSKRDLFRSCQYCL